MSLIVRAPLSEDDYIVLPRLSFNEIRYAAYHGLDRRMSAMEKGRNRYGQPHTPTWDDEVESSIAEYAFSKYKGLPWTGLIDVSEPDCGDEDVRHTVHLKGYLAIYERNDEKSERPLVLMDGRAPCYRIIGWAYIRDGKQAQYWNPDRETYCYPRWKLYPYERVIL